MVKKRRSKISTSQIIEDFKKVHQDTYDYSKVCYKTMHTKVTIVCKIHGEFTQTPNAHFKQKQGCKKCSDARNHNIQRDDTKSFIAKAKLIHKNKYNYNKTVYGKNAHEKVIITCPIHGDLLIIPNLHLSHKQGCRYCGFEKIAKLNRNSPTGWSFNNWVKTSKNSKDFDCFKVYIIKCFNDNETFYKIGRTFRKVESRFQGKTAMPYNYEIIKIYKGKAKEIYQLEIELRRINKINKYIPKTSFKGMNECYSKINKQ